MSKKHTKKVQSAEELNTTAILGTYEGECADADITNENGMDITRPVWENVFNSAEYANALEHGWYIGYLGHPEDPNCMDFKDACIVMREGHMDTDGKVYGRFDLIDTPVGRVVSAFQDAGVKFGISVRGAGDVDNNSVDPDTFVFRGFDLVTFPAFPNAIPEFSKIAASTDLEARKKYQKVCAAVNTNIGEITSVQAIETLQSQFAAQSDEYKALEARKAELLSEDDEVENIDGMKIEAMTNLYLQEHEHNIVLASELETLRQKLRVVAATAERKVKATQRIMASQQLELIKERDKLAKEKAILAATNNQLKSAVTAAQDSNLIYKQKMDNQDDTITRQEAIISGLRKKSLETVQASTGLKSRASNLDEETKQLKSAITACQKVANDFRQEYAKIVANTYGVPLHKLSIDSDTTVDDINRQVDEIVGSTNTSGIFTAPDISTVLVDEVFDEYDTDEDDIAIV